MNTVQKPIGFSFEGGFADLDFNPIPDMAASQNDYIYTERGGGIRATYVSTHATTDGLQQVLDRVPSQELLPPSWVRR